MSIRIFQIPARGCEETEAELNQFLASHRVLAMERHLVAVGENSYWAICVDYLERGAGGKATSTKNQRARVDYKELLSPEEFAQFAELRNLRKELAQEDGVPIYAVLTNEQLAQIVQQRVGSKTDLEKVAGIGEGRVAKYGDRIMSLLQAGGQGHETSEKSLPSDR